MRLTIASAEAGSSPIINCGSQIIPSTWGRVANLGEEQWDKTLLQKKFTLSINHQTKRYEEILTDDVSRADSIILSASM